MSLGSGFLENIPHFTFTPTEHQVECVRVASSKNLAFVLSRPQEKSFLVLMMVREAANSIRNGSGKAVILLHKPQQVTLWTSFLTRMTDMSVCGLGDDLPIDTGQRLDSGVLVTTHQTFTTLLSRKQIDLTSCRLLIVDNCQVGLSSTSLLYNQYKLLPKNMAPRLVTTTPNILYSNAANSDESRDGLASLPEQFRQLESLLPSSVECSCEVTSQLRYLARPTELLVLHPPGEAVEKIEVEIREVLEQLKLFLEDHEYSLWNTYGDGFADLIADIPDPAVSPIAIIEDFLGILTELGVWCADRAALILMIKIDKLKTREKYERHFLLLSVLFTTMIKIRKMCDDAYGDLTEREKLERFSRPKLIRLVEMLEIYAPAELSKPVVDAPAELSKPVVDAPAELSKPVVELNKFDVIVETVSEVVDNKLSDDSKNDVLIEEIKPTDKSTTPESSENGLKPPNPKDSTANSVPEPKNPSMRPARRGGGGRRQQSQEDPSALCALIVVDTTFTAKILYHFLKDLSRCRPDLSFLCPQYAVSDNKEPDPRDSENERKKQEEALRRFRMRECNVLVSSSVLEEGIDFVKCNLVIAFDPPKTFHRYVYSKVKVKSAGGSLVQLCQTSSRDQQLSRLRGYRRLEMCLLDHCTNRAAPASEDRDADRQVALIQGYPPHPSNVFSLLSTPYTPPLTLNNSILNLNRYCAKLPSDTFTRLTPSWTVERCSSGHFCALFLPINSPLKDLVIGRAMPSAALARRAAAFEACVRLHKIRELDDMMMPIGKESLVPPIDWGDGVRPGTTKRRQYYYKRVASCLTVTDFAGGDGKDEENVEEKTEVDDLAEKINTDMKISKNESDKEEHNLEDSLSSDNKLENTNELQDTEDDKLKARYAKLKVPEESQYNLYVLKMNLSCPIPDEQNTRGRKIHDPADACQQIGLLMPRNMPTIPVFPIYTRSGEVLVSVQLVREGLVLNQEQLRKIFTFHIFTFSSVLRLEKYPMVFHAENSQNCVVVVPLKSGEGFEIDWGFVDLIENVSVKKLNAVPEEDRVEFEFKKQDYSDAVIMPWYRNQDQPQYFYVAEICHHLSPASDFPGQGFDTFEKYYSTKYGIKIQNSHQPLLDVDHTSARLNFLTPRYVNRKGIALPTSSEETKRNKRENLDQKQILVPELCTIHPFPASLWRQTVSLPCTLYRLNGLLIADQIRRAVCLEMRMGLPEVGKDFNWPSLNFGWTLADVFVGGGEGGEGIKQVVKKKQAEKVDGFKEGMEGVVEEGGTPEEDILMNGEWDTDLGSLSDKLLNKLGEEEKRAKKKKLEIGMWTNDMAAQDVPKAQDGGKAWRAEEEDDTDLDDDGDLAGVELPDNLTFIGTGLGENWGTGVTKKGEPKDIKKGAKDWGTGIQMKNFRVGSPTFFSGSGRNNMAGLMDDLEGFSCSDSEDDWTDGEDEQVGSRIEFHGENVAETIDDTEECLAREERVARDRDQEASMVQDSLWNPMDLMEDEEENDAEDDIDANVEVVNEDQPSGIKKPGQITKDAACTPEQDISEFEPYCPLEKNEVHLDTVLGRLALAPNLVKTDLEVETPGVIPWPGIDHEKPYGFDLQPELANSHGPDPSLVLQALTMSNSNDAINLERLETIGDSFLKYAITSYLFCQHAQIHEGKLSHLRSKQVSNLNLYKLGRYRGLGECMIASKFEPHDNWLPPSYHVPRELEQALIESGVPASHWNMADLPGIESMTSAEICKLIKEKSEALRKDDDIEDLPSFIPYNLLTQHSIPDKSIADCVEALIGAYLISCGPRGALLFMSWLGLKVLPNDEDNCPGILQPPPSPLLKTPGISNPEGQLMYLLDGFSKFEHMIGYVWQDKSYLLQAFSHASYYPNRLTDCYQRLEFLGDAVLDYLITRHLYQDVRLHSPGALTDLRSALVNNTIFACLAVRHQFHKFFKHLSPGLQVVCDRFVRIQAENDWKVSEECYLIEEEESEEAEDIEVPKALGDIFESVAGSIFLDSGLSLDAVWKVYYRMMKDEIHQFSTHVPKSPIRELLELEPETAKFGKPEKLADGRRVRVSVEVFGKGSFKGIGRNYRIAKCTAAKCALKALRKIDHKKKQK